MGVNSCKDNTREKKGFPPENRFSVADARCKGVSEKTSLAFSFEFLALSPHAGPSAVLPHLQRSLLSTRTAVPESSSLAYLFRVETGVGFLIWVSRGET